MKTLAIDSATEACSVALFDEGVLVAGEFRMLGRGHAEQLVPMIAALPDQGRADRIVVSLGPGSFTGVRIGLAAARALAMAWKVEALGYLTLALVAAMARAERGGYPVSVCMTGGHGEWFVQDFGANGFPDNDLASLTPDAAASSVRNAIVAGTQAEALTTRQATTDLAIVPTPLPIWPDARSILLLPEDLLTANLSPLYGRGPDAKLPTKVLARPAGAEA